MPIASLLITVFVQAALLLAAFRLRSFEPSPWLWKLYLAEALLLAVLAVFALVSSRRKC